MTSYLGDRYADVDVDCDLLVVTLLSREGGVLVEALDGEHEESRWVSDVATAAVWIDSLLTQDLCFEVGVPEETPDVVGTSEVAETQSAGEPTQSATEHSERPPSGGPLAVLSLDLGAAWAPDRSTWTTLAVDACVRFTWLCVGIVLRGTLDAGLSGRSHDLESLRGGLEALASLVVPVTRGDWVLAPGIGLGAGWTQSHIEPSTSQDVGIDSGGLRVQASLRVSRTLRTRWAIGAGIYGVVDPLAHTTDFVEDESILPGNPRFRFGLSIHVSYGSI